MLYAGGLALRAMAPLRHLASRTVLASGTQMLKEYDNTDVISSCIQALSRQQRVHRASRAFKVVAERDSIDVRFNRAAQVGNFRESGVGGD